MQRTIKLSQSGIFLFCLLYVVPHIVSNSARSTAQRDYFHARIFFFLMIHVSGTVQQGIKTSLKDAHHYSDLQAVK